MSNRKVCPGGALGLRSQTEPHPNGRMSLAADRAEAQDAARPHAPSEIPIKLSKTTDASDSEVVPAVGPRRVLVGCMGIEPILSLVKSQVHHLDANNPLHVS